MNPTESPYSHTNMKPNPGSIHKTDNRPRNYPQNYNHAVQREFQRKRPNYLYQLRKHPKLAFGVVILAVVAIIFVIKINSNNSIGAKKTNVPEFVLPKNFISVNKTTEDIHTGELILVNKQHECEINGENLESVIDNSNKKYQVSSNDVKANKVLINALNDMLGDFYKYAGKTDVMVASCFRSYVKQEKLYQDEIAQVGKSEAGKWVAIPGYSEHQTGFAVDLTLYNKHLTTDQYNGKGIYSWINENCYKYGLVQRYQTSKNSITQIYNEPWHFRYLGEPHAYYMNNNNFCFEEYVDLLHSRSKSNPLVFTDYLGKKWAVYYVASTGFNTQVSVPVGYSYTISGDNVNGFFVTVML
ncbi:MAG: M15 family metallopeptidase [Bacillota bacterium]|nr:M15 family metallopeptidase [Bacillota bacterium]